MTPTPQFLKQATERGERRHETCRYGRLTETWTVEGGSVHPPSVREALDRGTPGLAPLCSFEPKGPVPPALLRAWGGLVDFAQDCAMCDAYEEVGE